MELKKTFSMAGTKFSVAQRVREIHGLAAIGQMCNFSRGPRGEAGTRAVGAVKMH
jgi:hypothetical protein